jgi:predicted RNase H-like HicB family nuclease
MNSTLWEQAEELARCLYAIAVEQDNLTNGQIVYLMRHPELPGCKAQGSTIDEAKANLDEARVDYIFALLEMGLDIPSPLTPTPLNVTTTNSIIRVFDASATRAEEFDGILDRVAQSETRIYLYGVSLQGDFIKHC